MRRLFLAIWFSVISTFVWGQDLDTGSTLTFKEQLALRQQKLEAVIYDTDAEGNKIYSEAFNNYLNVPLGRTGLPLVVYRLAPTLIDFAPIDDTSEAEQVRETLQLWADIWADPSAYGLSVHPSAFNEQGQLDATRTQRTLPLGLGWTNQTDNPLFDWNVNLVYVSCGSCHTGRVLLEDESVLHLYGAPSQEYDQIAFSSAVSRTINAMPTESAALDLLASTIGIAIEATLEQYGTEFFYGTAADRAVWGDLEPITWEREKNLWFTPWWLRPFVNTPVQVLETVKEGLSLRDRIISFLQNGVDGPYDQVGAPDFNSGAPGRLDAFGFGAAIVTALAEGAYDPLCTKVPFWKSETEKRACVPDIESEYGPAGTWLYRGAAKVDPTSIWQENSDYRLSANWDGSQKFAGSRAISTSLAVTANPEAVNIHGAEMMTDFMAQLPPPAYPFTIDEAAALRGKPLYEKYCANCHAPRNDRIYTIEEIDTDPNRALQITPPVREGLLAFFWQTCGDNDFCGADENGDLADNEQILVPRVPANFGYVAAPLDGIWARAPYLHNGSVPSLRALMTGIRPDTFWRGNIRYDQHNVGFLDQDPNVAPYPTMTSNAKPFDTQFIGNSNAGHLYEVIDGVPIHGADEQGQAIDWASPAYAQALNDLLEYLKTL